MGALKSPGPDPERQAFAGELRALIESAIEALPEHYRAVFVMRDVEGMSTAESADNVPTSPRKQRRLACTELPMLLRDTLYERAGIESAAAFSFDAPRCDRVVSYTFLILRQPTSRVRQAKVIGPGFPTPFPPNCPLECRHHRRGREGRDPSGGSRELLDDPIGQRVGHVENVGVDFVEGCGIFIPFFVQPGHDFLGSGGQICVAIMPASVAFGQFGFAWLPKPAISLPSFFHCWSVAVYLA